MRIAVVFDSPYAGWTSPDHLARMHVEMDRRYEGEADMEYQIAAALISQGHDVTLIGVGDDPGALIDALDARPVDVAFNASETFGDDDDLDFLLPALLDSQGVPYTGASPVGLMISRNKAMTKKILAHHGIHVPPFVVYRRGEPVTGPIDVPFPAIVKPLRRDASTGIAQASIVRDASQLAERVRFVHDSLDDAAIVEQFIEGRELYVSLLGNDAHVALLPIIELAFDKDRTKPEERIATQSVKWDAPYRRRKGIKSVFARPLSQRARARIDSACRTAYRALWLRDYARVDLRLDRDDRVWVLEANANPYVSIGHETAESARKAGIPYPQLIERIVREALRRTRGQPKR